MRRTRATDQNQRPSLSQESLAWLLSGYFLLTAQVAFWRALLGDGVLPSDRVWPMVAALAVIIFAAHALLFGAVFNRWTVKPVSIALLLTTAAAGYFMSRYTVFLDDDMLRNILHSDAKEAGELVGAGLLLHVAIFGALPAFLVWKMPLRTRSWRSAALHRSMLFTLAVALIAGAYFSQRQGVAAFARNQKDLRELIAPGNYLAALIRVGRSEIKGRSEAPIRIGIDARRASAAQDRKPRLLVLVLGETVRAANWGLNGYVRQTTPELARRSVLNFPDVTACGTSTEISLPCMFSPEGERGYDRERLRRSESLLHVLARTGVDVLWRDNQTGCKGTCAGLPFENFELGGTAPGCTNEGCLDEAMSEDLEQVLARHPGDFVLVLHMLGNHGPAYFKRYPDAFEHWTPTCREEDLSQCSDEAIRNAYDNAILYGDHWIATLIDHLQRHTAHDTVLWYLSDHGESLGESGLYLHGVPRAVAPDVQLKVPMVMWLDETLEASEPGMHACLEARSMQPARHDQLFHSVLGWFGVTMQGYRPDLDLFHDCKGGVLAHADVDERPVSPLGRAAAPALPARQPGPR